MKWIKASDLLPNHFEKVFIKHTEHGGGAFAQWDGVRKVFLNNHLFGPQGGKPENFEWLDESIQEGEERMFTLKEVSEIWECGYDQGYWDESEHGTHLGEHGDEKFNYEKKNKYFRDKFGINLEK